MNYVIIGGGASGMTCAINLAQKGYKVTILEKNDTLGKKILKTGNGRCNLFNTVFDTSKYQSMDEHEIKRLINKDNEALVYEFFNDIGLVTYNKDNYLYPYSNNALSVLNALLNKLKILGVEIITNSEVTDIIKENKFRVITTNKEYRADKVVIAVGSNANFKEVNNTMYKILKKMGHTIYRPLPGLVSLIGNDTYEWAGIRTKAKLSLYEDDMLLKEEVGEIQLTNEGISGICVFNLSNYASRGLNLKKEEIIKINFIPLITKDNAYSYLEERSKKLKDYTLFETLEALLPIKLLKYIFKISLIKTSSKWENLTKKEIEILINNLTNYEFKVIKTNDFLNSQVSIGGLSLKEINNNFESTIVKDLYILGEMLDCTGICGGYNLGLAWISGLKVD